MTTDQTFAGVISGCCGNLCVPRPNPLSCAWLPQAGHRGYVLFFLYLHGKSLHVSILEIKRQAVTNDVEARYVRRKWRWDWVHGLSVRKLRLGGLNYTGQSPLHLVLPGKWSQSTHIQRSHSSLLKPHHFHNHFNQIQTCTQLFGKETPRHGATSWTERRYAPWL